MRGEPTATLLEVPGARARLLDAWRGRCPGARYVLDLHMMPTSWGMCAECQTCGERISSPPEEVTSGCSLHACRADGEWMAVHAWRGPVP